MQMRTVFFKQFYKVLKIGAGEGIIINTYE
jgi:hypothetical protein